MSFTKKNDILTNDSLILKEEKSKEIKRNE